MRLKFLGTRGEIEEFSKKHRYHSSLLITDKKTKILVDYGIIHKNDLKKINPDAIIITHAHPDHYIWTKEQQKTKIPVYLTKKTFGYGKFKPENYKIITPGKKFKIKNFQISPYKVLHSIRCPAIGLRISFKGKTMIYNPDLVDIVNKNKILKKVDYYIGDGSCIRANLVRKTKIKPFKIFGHARIITQINWCKKYNIKKIIFTHFGKETIREEKKFKKKHPEIIMAYDGLSLNI